MTLCSAGVMGSFDFFEKKAPRKTAENTAKHRDGGVGLVVANHRGGSESSVVVTTLVLFSVKVMKKTWKSLQKSPAVLKISRSADFSGKKAASSCLLCQYRQRTSIGYYRQ